MIRQPTDEPTSIAGTFEYIEAKIRRDAEGTTSFGFEFEWLCKWLLETAPSYRGQFDKVWLWKDWPDRWGGLSGIDLVARTRTGELWAIQAKAYRSDRPINKPEIDKFLSDSARAKFAHRLLMGTTDHIGRTARETISGQDKPVTLFLRGHFLTAEVQWPVQIGGAGTRLPPWPVKPHQTTAIEAVANGFRDHDRGQLIMACGTGKTLTALWIAERLQSSLTLVLVPSLSLVQQNLAEWGRNAAADFDTLIVCSDETVGRKNADEMIQSAADLAVKPTTDPEQIRHFLQQRRKRPAVVFATYQSSNRIAAAQAGKTKTFDLVICDESHRLAGDIDGEFATVLDGKKIKASKRLFMTATPRYIKDHVKRRAAELDTELVSMDDVHVFGPEFHALEFHEAMNAKPVPLLTDYQVVVIGVTDRDAKAWAEEARLVRTAEDLRTDARTLAAQIGLAKAMQKYNLRKIITFHSTVAKAARFVDATQRDSLPGVISHLKRSVRPSGTLWTKHISGETPAGMRGTLLKEFAHLPEDTRGILSNCACLGEGVDVPVLDGVAFIDPKRSMVDIIQAVGRVIRKAAGKPLGTIVIPVFIDESEDADHVLSQSAFEPVWQVLKALRAHDRRLADELDQLRLSLGKRSKSGGRINLPDNIKLDVPRLLLRNFEQAFYVRTVEQTTDKPRLTIEQILAWADEHKATAGNWPNVKSGQVSGADETWKGIDYALREGKRSLSGGSSLAKLLSEHRGIRNIMDLPPLTIEQVLVWADAHFQRTEKWPTTLSGSVFGVPDENWPNINTLLVKGLRGLPGGSSIAQLLKIHRGRRNQLDLPLLTIEKILEWADNHFQLTGEWPKKASGPIHDDREETWSAINSALIAGIRGLPGGSSLPKLLAEYRGVRNVGDPQQLSVDQILSWADAHHGRTGLWPNQKAGSVHEAPDERWNNLDSTLNEGGRGLSGGSSLAKLLAKYRGVRNRMGLEPLSINQILVWADSHHHRTGSWPMKTSGQIEGSPAESWSGINVALRNGTRGLAGGSSLAKLLVDHRGVRSKKHLPPLTAPQILAWADAHHDRLGEWPDQDSGRVHDARHTTWKAIHVALCKGGRGLPIGSSLAKFLAEHRSVRNRMGLPPLTVDEILDWVDEHYMRTGEWPRVKSGPVAGTNGESWAGIDNTLRSGRRGLPAGSSLAMLLAENRGVRSKK